MSGPKIYKVSISDEQVNETLQLKASIQQDFARLSRLEFRAEGQVFDCAEFIRNNRQLMERLLAKDHQISETAYGTAQRDAVSQRITDMITELRAFHAAIGTAANNFEQVKQSVYAYRKYQQIHQNYTEQWQRTVQEFQKSHAHSFAPELLQEVTHELAFPGAEPFSKSFNEQYCNAVKRLETQQNSLQDALHAKLKLLGERKVFTQFLSADASQTKAEAGNPIIPLTVQAINRLSNEILDDESRTRFLQVLKDNLARHPNDEYYFLELEDNLRQYLKRQECLQQISVYEVETPVEIHPQCQALWTDIRQKLAGLKASKRLCTKDICDWTDHYSAFLKTNDALLKERHLESLKAQYIKKQLIRALHELHYETLMDVEVIDFEQTDAFVLKVPEQNNYLQLEIGSDANIMYRFMMQEDKSEMNQSHIDHKLDEMRAVCSEFKTLVRGLSEQGLSFDLQMELEVEESKLLTLPADLQQKAAHHVAQRHSQKARQHELRR